MQAESRKDEIELAEERNELPDQRWLDQLLDPGTSLGGARPKANVVDTDGKLYVAKFPSKKDLENTELIEHFSSRAKRRGTSLIIKVLIIKYLHFHLLSKRLSKISLVPIKAVERRYYVDCRWCVGK